jgi:hypothetical protein
VVLRATLNQKCTTLPDIVQNGNIILKYEKLKIGKEVVMGFCIWGGGICLEYQITVPNFNQVPPEYKHRTCPLNQLLCCRKMDFGRTIQLILKFEILYCLNKHQFVWMSRCIAMEKV